MFLKKNKQKQKQKQKKQDKTAPIVFTLSV